MYKLDTDLLIAQWYAEDIGEGDHTTLSTIPCSARGRAKLLVKEEGIAAGVDIAQKLFHKLDPELEVISKIPDGSPIVPGNIILTVEGSVRSILQSERLVLNVMQRMSGIATTTGKYVKLIEGTGAKVLDTRKTTPGFRYFEKEAVRIGGGVNHRIGLYDMILIKDNHIDFAGGIPNALSRTRDYLKEKGLNLKIEIEVRSIEDIKLVLKAGGADRILIDNFSVELTREAVKLINGVCETESSGGITIESIRSYAECGVDFISVGALTHHVKSLDLSLKAEF